MTNLCSGIYEELAVMKISLGDIKNLLPQRLSIGISEQWEGTFDPEELYLTGHSMGGADCVSCWAWYHSGSFICPPGIRSFQRSPGSFRPPTNQEGSDVRCIRSPTLCHFFRLIPSYFSPMKMTVVPTVVHDVPVFCNNSESWTVW